MRRAPSRRRCRSDCQECRTDPEPRRVRLVPMDILSVSVFDGAATIDALLIGLQGRRLDVELVFDRLGQAMRQREPILRRTVAMLLALSQQEFEQRFGEGISR